MYLWLRPWLSVLAPVEVADWGLHTRVHSHWHSHSDHSDHIRIAAASRVNAFVRSFQLRRAFRV